MSTVKWDRENTKMVHVKLNKNTDADILKKLEELDNIQGYIKALIREDIKRGANTMKTYTVKAEYIDQWFGKEDIDPGYIITQDELERLAVAWGKPVEELLEQLIEQ